MNGIENSLSKFVYNSDFLNFFNCSSCYSVVTQLLLRSLKIILLNLNFFNTNKQRAMLKVVILKVEELVVISSLTFIALNRETMV